MKFHIEIEYKLLCLAINPNNQRICVNIGILLRSEDSQYRYNIQI